MACSSGDLLLVGSAERMDLAGNPELRAVHHRARARRLVSVLAGPEGWAQARDRVTALLTDPEPLHRALQREHAEAAVSRSSTRDARPVPSTVGGFVRAAAPPLLRAVARAARGLLTDLPSAGWAAVVAAGANGPVGASAAAVWERLCGDRAAVQQLAGACDELAAAAEAASDGEAERALAAAAAGPEPLARPSALAAAVRSALEALRRCERVVAPRAASIGNGQT
jgi:hypothetical protein